MTVRCGDAFSRWSLARSPDVSFSPANSTDAAGHSRADRYYPRPGSCGSGRSTTAVALFRCDSSGVGSSWAHSIRCRNSRDSIRQKVGQPNPGLSRCRNCRSHSRCRASSCRARHSSIARRSNYVRDFNNARPRCRGHAMRDCRSSSRDSTRRGRHVAAKASHGFRREPVRWKSRGKPVEPNR